MPAGHLPEVLRVLPGFFGHRNNFVQELENGNYHTSVKEFSQDMTGASFYSFALQE
jgi:hypothetical protein